MTRFPVGSMVRVLVAPELAALTTTFPVIFIVAEFPDALPITTFPSLMRMMR